MSTRATAESIALLPCPRSGCGTAFSEAGPLAAHLATVHETAPSHAHLEAQTVKQQTANAANAKEATMPCTYCKRADGTHSERCQTRARTRVCKMCAMVSPDKCARHGGPRHREGKKHVQRTRPRDARPELTNGVRETARTLLGQLEAMRATLDAKITLVRELAESP